MALGFGNSLAKIQSHKRQSGIVTRRLRSGGLTPSFKAKWYPFGPVLSVVLCVCIILGQFYAYEDFTLLGFIVAYFGLFIFFACYLGYKFVKRRKASSRWKPT
jgi:amino acid permease